jgi:DNA-directed RNA polymerase sigma subunit (sigma70/sigma32)
MSEFDKYWSDLENEFGHIRSPANRFAKKVWDKKELKISQLKQQLQEEKDHTRICHEKLMRRSSLTVEEVATMRRQLQEAVSLIQEAKETTWHTDFRSYREKANKFLEQIKAMGNK